MKISKLSFKKCRWITKFILITIIIIVPFITIDDRSILRFDIQSLKLYILGSTIWMEDFFIVLLGMLFITFLFITLTIIFGRIWCGWACPQTILNDIMDLARKKPKNYVLQFIVAILLSLFVSLNLIWYFITPYDFLRDFTNSNLGEITISIWVGMTVIVFLNLVFIKRSFCAYLCPYSRLQSIMLDDKSLVIAFDEQRKTECMNCKACIRACPVNIDIREGLNPACINCTECIDKCKTMTAKVGKDSLINFNFGFSRNGINLVRTQVIIFACITLICLIALIVSISMKSDIAINISIDNSVKIKRIEGGYSLIPIKLSLSNKKNSQRELSIKVYSKDKFLFVTPDKYLVNPESHQQYPLRVLLPNDNMNNSIDIIITYDNNKSKVKTLHIGKMEAYF